MTNKSDLAGGGPAFPIDIHPRNLGEIISGITIWQYYAAHALNGLSVRTDMWAITTPEVLADVACRYADAMLAEQAKRFWGKS